MYPEVTLPTAQLARSGRFLADTVGQGLLLTSGGWKPENAAKHPTMPRVPHGRDWLSLMTVVPRSTT